MPHRGHLPVFGRGRRRSTDHIAVIFFRETKINDFPQFFVYKTKILQIGMKNHQLPEAHTQ